MKILVTGFLTLSLAEGLQAFHKESEIKHESEVFGADSVFKPLAELCKAAKANDWVLLTRYTSVKAAPGELHVLRQSGATVLMLAPALAQMKHDAQGKHLLACWSFIGASVAANAGLITEIPARPQALPWKLL